MAASRVRHALLFLGQLWLPSFRKAVWVAVIGIMVASVRVSFSQINGSGDGSGISPTTDDGMNSTADMSVLDASCLNSNMQCGDLPAICLNCSYDEVKNCVYGDNASVSCVPLPGVECQVSQCDLFY